MGRGRQKAKQRKVARDLKYYTPDTDYAALERELKADHSSFKKSHFEGDADDLADRYAEDVEDGDEDEADWDPNDIPPAIDD